MVGAGSRPRPPATSLAADQNELTVGLVGDHIPRAYELPDRAVLRDRSRRPAREDPVRVAVPRGVRRKRGGRDGDGAARAARDAGVELDHDLIGRVRARTVDVVLLVRADDRSVGVTVGDPARVERRIANRRQRGFQRVERLIGEGGGREREERRGRDHREDEDTTRATHETSRGRMGAIETRADSARSEAVYSLYAIVVNRREKGARPSQRRSRVRSG